MPYRQQKTPHKVVLCTGGKVCTTVFCGRAVLHWLLQKSTGETVQGFAYCKFLDAYSQSNFHRFLTGELPVGRQSIVEAFLFWSSWFTSDLGKAVHKSRACCLYTSARANAV